MSPVETKIEKNKTVVVNIQTICDAIGRDKTQLRKFLSQKLALGSSETKDKTLLNGSKSQSEVQEAIFEFIDEFVLCGSCGNPETIFRNGSNLSLKCLACGWRTKLSGSKMATAIQNSLKDAPKKRKKRVRKVSEEKTPEIVLTESESDNDWLDDTSEEAIAERRAAELSGTASSLVRH